jgi:hypothetical protein
MCHQISRDGAISYLYVEMQRCDRSRILNDDRVLGIGGTDSGGGIGFTMFNIAE